MTKRTDNTMEIFYVLIPTGDHLRYECSSMPDFSTSEWRHRKVLGCYYTEKKVFEVTLQGEEEDIIDAIANVAWWYCDREITVCSKFGSCTIGSLEDAADAD